MKRIIAAMLVIVMALTMAGCSGDEVGLYSLIKEVMLLEAIETSGTASITMQGQLVGEMTKKLPKELEALKKIFDPGMELRYSMKQSKKTSDFEVSVELRFKGETQYQKLTKLIGNKKVAYVKLDDIFRFLKPYIVASEPKAEKAVDEIIAKIEYLEVDLEKGSYKGVYKKGYNGTAQDEKVIRVFIGFMDIFKDAFSGFSSGAVTKKANGYEVSLEVKDLKPLIIKFMEYFTKNIDTIADVSAKKVNAMSEEEFNAFKEVMGDTVVSREKVISGIEDMREDVKKTFPAQIEKMKTDMSFDIAVEGLKGSSYKYYLGKSGNGDYELSNNLKIRFQQMISVDIVEEAVTKKIAAFTITKPANSVNEEEYKAIIESIIPPSVSEIRVNVNNGNTKLRYTNSKTKDAKADIIQKEGFSYLSLSTLRETFGEDISWDAAKKAAFANVQGNKVYLDGIAGNGKNYVKVKELSKLGYFVWWDKWTDEVVIVRSSRKSIFN